MLSVISKSMHKRNWVKNFSILQATMYILHCNTLHLFFKTVPLDKWEAEKRGKYHIISKEEKKNPYFIVRKEVC